MNENLLKLLQKVDTPTVCNAIEFAQGKRGFNAFTRGTMLASHPDAPAMVGLHVPRGSQQSPHQRRLLK